MRLALRLHPNSLSFAATQLEVDVARPGTSTLVLSYAVTGRMRDLQLPPVVPMTRTDELWRHTCFEAFLRTLPGAAYHEFNFAPSTQWAAYRFSSYRSRIRAASALRTPQIEVQSSPERFSLQATLELDELSNLPPNATLRLGLAAVIEETSWHKSYWALVHPPGKPDFHHSDGFAYELS
jgi:hypothetical protein